MSEYEDLIQELEQSIHTLQKRIEEDQAELASLQLRLRELKKQQLERVNYISSSEILELIFSHTGKESNMSTIKRWADQGFLGEVIDEKEAFWALKTKQGKKRFLYPKKQVLQFLYEKTLIRPKFNILDRVRVDDRNHPNYGKNAVVVKGALQEDEFHYTLQLEDSFEKLEGILESQLLEIEYGDRSGSV